MPRSFVPALEALPQARNLPRMTVILEEQADGY